MRRMLVLLQSFDEIMKVVKSLCLMKAVVIEVKPEVIGMKGHKDKTARRVRGSDQELEEEGQ